MLDIGGVLGVVVGGVGRGVIGVVVVGEEKEGEEEETSVVSSSRPPKYLTACIHRPEGV